MALTLTTPLEQPGLHGEAGATYGEVKIVAVGLDLIQKQLSMTCQYGDTIADEWTPAPLPDVVHTIQNIEPLFGTDGEVLREADPAYDLFMAASFASSTATFLYDEVADSLYQWLIDEDIYEGSHA